MPKELTIVLDNATQILKELRVDTQTLVLTLPTHTHDASGTRMINLRLSAQEVIDAAFAVNKRLNKVSKLEKRIEKLEGKKK